MRVLHNREFRSIYAKRQRVVGEFIIIDSVYKGSDHLSRLGVVVSTRFGRAHRRNRFKRLVRESFRLLYSKLPQGWDFAIRPRSAADQSSLSNIQNELLTLSHGLKVYVN